MKVIKVKDYNDLSRKAADVIADRVKENPKIVLGLATGSTPVGTYSELATKNKEGLVDFSRVTTFNLDEYYGLAKDHPQSYRYFMMEKLFRHINIKLENVHIPNGMALDPQEECEQYEKAIEAAGGIDLQLLGIGRNGHIAFNEPNDYFTRQTALVNLSESTIEANQRFFESGEVVPKQALSMGINTIMQAKSILLLASGADKKDALEKMIHQNVTPQCPASVLQFHPNATVMYCD